MNVTECLKGPWPSPPPSPTSHVIFNLPLKPLGLVSTLRNGFFFFNVCPICVRVGLSAAVVSIKYIHDERAFCVLHSHLKKAVSQTESPLQGPTVVSLASLVAQMVKSLPAMQ